MKTKVKPKKFLSDRWKEAESPMPQGSRGFGKLGYGNPTWAHGVSRPFGSEFNPIRPEVKFERVASRSISSIRALREAADRISRLREAPHDPSSIVAPSMSGKREVEKAMKECEESAKACDARFQASFTIDYALHHLKKNGGVIKEYA